MKEIAGDWGDTAPPGTTTTIPAFNAFLASIDQSDAIQGVMQMVQERDNTGAPTRMLPLSYVTRFYGPADLASPSEPNWIGNLNFEILVTLYADHGPISVLHLNAAQFAVAWRAAIAADAATAPTSTPAMDALIAKTFPGVDVAVYKINKELYQAQLAAHPTTTTPAKPVA